MRIAKDEVEVEEVQSKFSVLNFLFLFVLIVVMAGSYFVYSQIYNKHVNSNLTQWVVDVLPIPAGSVNGDAFFYKEVFAFDSLAVLEGEVEDSFGTAIDAIVRQKLIEQFADELNVSVDTVSVDQDQWTQYGWTQDQYEDYVLIPLALAGAVDEAIYSSLAHQQSVIGELEHVVSLFESGITFDDLAVQYSEIASGQFGGDAGYVCIDDLDEEMKGVWMREVDQISEVIELEDRFVVAAAYDLVESEDTEACTQIGWQKIVLYKNTLSDLLADYKDSAVIKIYGQ